MRGGEKCLEPICRLFPNAQLFALLHSQGSVSSAIERLRPRTSWLQFLPGVRHYYRYLLPVMPLAARWSIPDADLVLSFSHCVAKSAEPAAGVSHVCYCFTPMRYAWHLRESYFREERGLKRRMIEALLRRLRDWDRATAERVTHFVAISRTVQERIRDCYGRESEVIHPPVDTDFYTPGLEAREDFYLCVSALAPYKRIDLAIEACNRLKRRLLVIGSGQEARRLRALAGPTVEFLGWQSDEVIRDHYRRCRALLFPGEEDFGIVPVEAQACGTPVIALGKGGAVETVTERTGVFFAEQTPEALIAAIESFERDAGRFDVGEMRRQALKFRAQRYEEEMLGLIERLRRGPQVLSHSLPSLVTEREQKSRPALLQEPGG
jgi:glycosyltransferase involved in cell wall biosynthesis